MQPTLAVNAVYIIHEVNIYQGQVIPEIAIPTVSKFTGESALCRFVKVGNHFATYVQLGSISIASKKLAAVTGGAIAGNFRAALTDSNHKDHYSYPDAINNISTTASVTTIVSEIDHLPLTRITADHHQNVTKHELLEAYKVAESECEGFSIRHTLIFILLKRSKELRLDNKVSMTTFATYVLVAPIFAVAHLALIVAEAEDDKHFEMLLKDESGAAKQQQTLWRDDLSCVYELNTLRNRVYEKLNWGVERDHRIELRTVPISTSDVYTLSTQIFKDAKDQGKRVHSYKWSDYWRLRWSRFPGGSIVSQYDEDMRLKRSLKQEAKIKCAWFSAITDNKQGKWLSRTPEIYATTSTKYEWGKVRALYGCDVTSFIHSDFAMPNCEDALPNYFPVGKAANQENVERTMRQFDETIPVCFDYDDFNSQHSKASMKAVLCAWRDQFYSDLTDEQLLSLEWTIESIDTMKVRFNELKETVEIKGTLMSGWRLTTFINTVLNRVYLMKAGMSNLAVYALHNGDDVFAGCGDMERASTMIRAALHNGIRAQVSKTNIGTIGEFLRIDTRAKNPTAKQYLSRSVATAVHGRVETSAPNDLFALVKANDTRMNEMLSRGANEGVVKAIALQLDKFVARLFSVNVEVINTYRELHPIQGGCNENAELRKYRLLRVTSPIDNSTADDYSLIRPGIYEYADAVIDKFKLPKDIVSRKKLFRTAVVSLLRDKISYEIVIDDRWNVTRYRMVYKAWAKSGYVADISKLRTLGVIVAKDLRGVTNAAASAVRNSYDPLAMMQYAF